MRSLMYLAMVLISYPLFFNSVAHAQSKGAEQIEVTAVMFEIREPGLDPYYSRMLLSRDWLRLDDGSDHSDFILFNRKEHIIHSFNHDDGTQLVINPHDKQIDFSIEYNHQQKVLSDAPEVLGDKVVEHRYFANGKLCKVSMNASQLLPELREVLLSYEGVLQLQNRMTFDNLPSALRNGCYVSNNYLHAGDYLKPGFPLRVSEPDGVLQILINFETKKVLPKLFVFPEGYRTYYATPPAH